MSAPEASHVAEPAQPQPGVSDAQLDQLRRRIEEPHDRQRERLVVPNNTPAGRAAQRPQAVPVYSQAETRRRRLAGLPTVNYGSVTDGWSLCREIAEVVGPLASRIAASERPGRFSWRGSQVGVHDLIEGVHEIAGDITGWLAEAEARTKTAHLAGDPGKRRYAMTTLCDLAPRPKLPEVTDAMIADGTWAAALVEMVAPLDGPLADLLRRAYSPDAPELRGALSRSERLERLLRESLDRPVAELVRRLDRADREAAKPGAVAKAEAARAELAAMGVEV